MLCETFEDSIIGIRMNYGELGAPRSLPHPLSSRPMSVILLNLTIAILGLAFLVCLLFGFVTFINAHNAFKRVQGQPYQATTFQVTRPYYQKSHGMHGPDISVYASGMVEGKKEWMNLVPYLKRVPRDQAELNDSVPPGEASRRTETWVLRRAPVALVVLGALILLLVQIRRFCASPATRQ